MDAKINITTQQQQKGVYIAQFKVHDLAIFSYYVQSEKEAYLIDPTYDHFFYLDFIKKRGSTLKYVLLTHYHADFLSGHTQFGVPIIMGQKSKRSVNKFEVKQYEDNKSFTIGKVSTRVLATPGHTLQSACFVLGDQTGKQFCIFSGDTVFLGEVGRPDLAVAAGVITKQDLAGMLYESIQKLKKLDQQLRLYPGHGAGSACGKSIGAGNFCNLKNQHIKNYGFLLTEKKDFIQKLTAGLQSPPNYFFYDAKLNQSGPPINYDKALLNSKKPISIQQLKAYIQKGLTIVDTRHELGNGLIKGTYWMTIKGDLSTWVSMIIKPQQQFIVITDQGKQQDVIERFLRIGYFGIKGYNGFKMEQWKGETYKPEIKSIDQLDKTKKYIHLDVRNRKQWKDTGTLNDAVTISLHELDKRIHEVIDLMKMSDAHDIVVNCKGGIRARFASSILLKNGIKPIVLNENIQKIHQKGVKLVEYKYVSEQNQCCQIF